ANSQIKVHSVHPSTFHPQKDRRVQVAEFYSARSRVLRPLQWPSIAPPLTAATVSVATKTAHVAAHIATTVAKYVVISITSNFAQQ
ncbi:MAG: hypothetical protein QF511_12645, partial [Rhodospirillales bacterium]|nr:hypothetical protein [Rhodospirillales bacterium]